MSSHGGKTSFFEDRKRLLHDVMTTNVKEPFRHCENRLFLRSAMNINTP